MVNSQFFYFLFFYFKSIDEAFRSQICPLNYFQEEICHSKAYINQNLNWYSMKKHVENSYKNEIFGVQLFLINPYQKRIVDKSERSNKITNICHHTTVIIIKKRARVNVWYCFHAFFKGATC